MAFEKPQFKLKINKRLHSREHVLADDLSRIMGEPKKFAAYLGIAKLYDEFELRNIAKRILAKKDLPPENRGKYFFGSLKRLPKKSGIRFKNRKRKKKRFYERNSKRTK